MTNALVAEEAFVRKDGKTMDQLIKQQGLKLD
jgi:hypothetical protein